ncbi:hypothetical protein An08g10840 [Aspergillus niger]|uniref:Uncharacterized protein n=2 Tax=Aspergillus niger TaxID=5061 RepID=A2QSI5_ASPNC|nr:hypothetical protein An08g10840 [Aspergillus niger]CAK45757.1 hypothetical protein An08g10840 [Aspergillus niger]
MRKKANEEGGVEKLPSGRDASYAAESSLIGDTTAAVLRLQHFTSTACPMWISIALPFTASSSTRCWLSFLLGQRMSTSRYDDVLSPKGPNCLANIACPGGWRAEIGVNSELRNGPTCPRGRKHNNLVGIDAIAIAAKTLEGTDTGTVTVQMGGCGCPRYHRLERVQSYHECRCDPSDNLCRLQTLGPRGSSLSRDSITFSTVGKSKKFWEIQQEDKRGSPSKAINLTSLRWNRALVESTDCALVLALHCIAFALPYSFVVSSSGLPLPPRLMMALPGKLSLHYFEPYLVMSTSTGQCEAASETQREKCEMDSVVLQYQRQKGPRWLASG